MSTLVQKYGGTSVRTQENRRQILINAREAISEGHAPVIVVSAMGRAPSPYATDTLLGLLPSPDEASLRNRDLIASAGEILTAVIVAEEMTLGGLKALALTGGQAGICTDENYGSGNIISVDTSRLLALTEAGIIPVVAGFQGMSASGEILTLGRGGSDITATVLGGALKSFRVEIFTDVDGVMTADPNVVEGAELINSIDYENVFRLADMGAKVIHPRAVRHAMEADVPIVVLNAGKSRGEDHTVISSASSSPEIQESFSAVTSMGRRTQMELVTSGMAQEDEIFTRIAENGISIDMISIHPNRKNFIVSEEHAPKVLELCAGSGVAASAEGGFSKITVLGNHITGKPGIFARIIAILYAEKIPVFHSSDSANSIAVLVRSDQEKTAVRLLHDALI